MFEETEEAIKRAFRDLASNTGNGEGTRSRAIRAMLIGRDEYDVPGSVPSTRQIGGYLDSNRDLGDIFIEKEKNQFQNFHHWIPVEKSSINEEMGAVHRIECEECEWAYESPWISRLEEQADKHYTEQDGHTVTEPERVD